MLSWRLSLIYKFSSKKRWGLKLNAIYKNYNSRKILNSAVYKYSYSFLFLLELSYIELCDISRDVCSFYLPAKSWSKLRRNQTWGDLGCCKIYRSSTGYTRVSMSRLGLEVVPVRGRNLADRSKERSRTKSCGRNYLRASNMSVLGFDFPPSIWDTKVITPCSSITDLCPPKRMSLLLPVIFQQLDQTVAILLTLDNGVFIMEIERIIFFFAHISSQL